MKTIGLIGGMSWESTTLYYQIINREVGQRLGGLHSARIHLLSLDFEDLAHRQRADDWSGMAEILCDAARRLSASGADCVLIGTNTMHQVAPEVAAATELPLIHIADITADAIRAQGLSRVGLMGTRFTMERRFYKERLAERGIESIVPDEGERQEIHRIIFGELFRGELREASRLSLSRCIEGLRDRGAQGVVLGCTELPLIVRPQDSCLPIFDTTALHARAAVDFALTQ
jgi:aspartate racemase